MASRTSYDKIPSEMEGLEKTKEISNKQGQGCCYLAETRHWNDCTREIGIGMTLISLRSPNHSHWTLGHSMGRATLLLLLCTHQLNVGMIAGQGCIDLVGNHNDTVEW